jgi:ATP-dependent helicase/nuclease subunit A
VRRLGLDESWKTALQSLVTLIRANDIAPERLASFARDNAAALLSHFPTPTDEDLDQRLRQAIAAAQTAIEQAALSRGIKKNTQDYLAQLRAFDRSLTQRGAAWSEWVKLAKSAPEAGLKGLVEPIAELAGRLAEHRELHADLTQYLDRMFDLAARALTIYARQKRELGVLDFADQEHLLLKLLDHPAVADVLGEELDLLMVDEFQDTSPIQLALFLKLAGFARQVCWVGDIKQAIYGFRGSDSALMQAILQELPALGGSKEDPAGFLAFPPATRPGWSMRSSAMPLPTACRRRRSNSSRPARTSLAGAVLANWILTGRNQAQEAAALAVGVQKLVESGYQVVDPQTSRGRAIRHGDIAVLSRSHAGVQTIDQALRERGIPCATAQPGLLKTPEATLAMACLRRLDDPGDTLATAEIVSLADGTEPEQWVADRLRYLNAGGQADEWLEKDGEQGKAHPLLSRLARLRSSLPLLAPREGLQTVIAICELPCQDRSLVAGRRTHPPASGQSRRAARSRRSIRRALPQRSARRVDFRPDPLARRSRRRRKGPAGRTGDRCRQGDDASRGEGARMARRRADRSGGSGEGPAVVDLGAAGNGIQRSRAARRALHPLLALAVRRPAEGRARRGDCAYADGGRLPELRH